jgi:hypothetical protein
VPRATSQLARAVDVRCRAAGVPRRGVPSLVRGRAPSPAATFVRDPARPAVAGTRTVVPRSPPSRPSRVSRRFSDPADNPIVFYVVMVIDQSISYTSTHPTVDICYRSSIPDSLSRLNILKIETPITSASPNCKHARRRTVRCLLRRLEAVPVSPGSVVESSVVSRRWPLSLPPPHGRSGAPATRRPVLEVPSSKCLVCIAGDCPKSRLLLVWFMHDAATSSPWSHAPAAALPLHCHHALKVVV